MSELTKPHSKISMFIPGLISSMSLAVVAHVAFGFSLSIGGLFFASSMSLWQIANNVTAEICDAIRGAK